MVEAWEMQHTTLHAHSTFTHAALAVSNNHAQGPQKALNDDHMLHHHTRDMWWFSKNLRP
jgi:hypothetical protein